jgi:hypothetical protein
MLRTVKNRAGRLSHLDVTALFDVTIRAGVFYNKAKTNMCMGHRIGRDRQLQKQFGWRSVRAPARAGDRSLPADEHQIYQEDDR